MRTEKIVMLQIFISMAFISFKRKGSAKSAFMSFSPILQYEFQSKDWAGDGLLSPVKSRAPGPPLRLSNSLWCLSFRPCCYCHQVELRSIFVFHQLFIIVCDRKEFGLHFTRTHPFAAWLAHLSASFAGSLLSPLNGGEFIFASPFRLPGLQSSSGETGNYLRIFGKLL